MATALWLQSGSLHESEAWKSEHLSRWVRSQLRRHPSGQVAGDMRPIALSPSHTRRVVVTRSRVGPNRMFDHGCGTGPLSVHSVSPESFTLKDNTDLRSKYHHNSPECSPVGRLSPTWCQPRERLCKLQEHAHRPGGSSGLGVQGAKDFQHYGDFSSREIDDSTTHNNGPVCSNNVGRLFESRMAWRGHLF